DQVALDGGVSARRAFGVSTAVKSLAEMGRFEEAGELQAAMDAAFRGKRCWVLSRLADDRNRLLQPPGQIEIPGQRTQGLQTKKLVVAAFRHGQHLPGNLFVGGAVVGHSVVVAEFIGGQERGVLVAGLAEETAGRLYQLPSRVQLAHAPGEQTAQAELYGRL